MRVAILHSWFLMRGGGEKVIDVLAAMYPEADIYSLFVNPEMLSPLLRKRGVRASMLNAFPFSSKLHRHLMPLYPLAIESLDLSAYDLVISSCGPAMMGGSIRQDAIHICYCHTPQRSWWDLYAEHQLQLPPLLRPLFVMGAAWVRTWEFNAMQRVDYVISNSNYIAERVLKYFRRDSVVIYPPVSMSARPVTPAAGAYYLSVGRLEKQKRVDILINACNAMKRRLMIVGAGKEEQFLRSIAGPTVEFCGYVPDDGMSGLYSNCRAFLFAAIEDFGIAPVEAQAHGRPVIAYGFGGSLETVRVNDPEGRPDTGKFFDRQTADSLIGAIEAFEEIEHEYNPEEIRAFVKKFESLSFQDQFRHFVNQSIQKSGHTL